MAGGGVAARDQRRLRGLWSWTFGAAMWLPLDLLQLAANIPGARQATLGPGHLAFLEDSQTWLHLTVSFLQEHHNAPAARRAGRR